MKILEIIDTFENSAPKICYISRGINGSCSVNGNCIDMFAVAPGFLDKQNQGIYIILPRENFPLETGKTLYDFHGGVLLDINEKVSENTYRLTVNQAGFICLSDTLDIIHIIKTCILTVSDKGSRGERNDTSGPALSDMIDSIGSDILDAKIVPDERSAITSTIKQWINQQGPDVILVTGGTGLSSRDVTPEALRSISDSEIPGIGEYMRIKTSEFTERSILSRSSAHIIDRTLVISLPGSKKGSTQCLGVILPIIRHAVDIISARETECGTSS